MQRAFGWRVEVSQSEIVTSHPLLREGWGIRRDSLKATRFAALR
jgi:hypothetical protein